MVSLPFLDGRKPISFNQKREEGNARAGKVLKVNGKLVWKIYILYRKKTECVGSTPPPPHLDFLKPIVGIF